MKLITVVGTRPEIIRLSRLIPLLENQFDHKLVFSGQNSDPQLSEVFFKQLGNISPDVHLETDNTTFTHSISSTLIGVEEVIRKFNPDGMVVLGDTNSGLALFVARRLGVTTYHLEAGNRSFDPNVPEEVNRKLLDHISDYNLPYNDYSKANLISEGIHASSICVSGSPLPEVFEHFEKDIRNSEVLRELDLQPKSYILASLHRQENVDNRVRLGELIAGLDALSRKMRTPVLISLHPRTRIRLRAFGIELPDSIIVSEPFGYFDFCRLQQDALLVVSDSGTISEEASLLGIRAISPRPAFERPEGLEAAKVILSEPTNFVAAAEYALARPLNAIPARGYAHSNFSGVVAGYIMSTLGSHRKRTGLISIDL